MSNDDHIGRISSTPMTSIPADAIRTHAGTVKLMLGAAPDRSISVGLLIEGQPPLGHVEVYLTGDQVTELQHQLDELVRLSADETAALIRRLHDSGNK